MIYTTIIFNLSMSFPFCSYINWYDVYLFMMSRVLEWLEWPYGLQEYTGDVALIVVR